MLKLKARSELGPVFWAQQTWMVPLNESYPRGLGNFMLIKSKNHNLTFGNGVCVCLDEANKCSSLHAGAIHMG